MLKLEVNSKKLVLNLPTSVDEIPNEWLSSISETIVPAYNYSLIALISYEKLTYIANSIKRKEAMNTSVLPVFIKSGVTDSEFINSIKTGTPIVTVNSDLARAIHVNLSKNSLSPNRIISIITNDTELSRNLFNYTTPIAFVEFKLIPNCDIYGIYDNNKSIIVVDNFIQHKAEPSA